MAESTVSEIQSANNVVDRISQLPNEVLVDILSHLTFNEVGRSSVLSKRWRDLWKMTGRLNFGSGQQYVLDNRCNHIELKRRLHRLRSMVRTWVNHVVTLHECPSIEEFTMKFDLDTSAAQDIEEWIKFMIRKRVKTVDLDFSACRIHGIYTISKECCDYITSVSNVTNLVNLRSIRLNYVNVDGPLLTYLLSKCRYLEVLSVTMSCTLLYLKVVDPPALKYLECHSCSIVRKIKIQAPKLEKFVYYGRVVKFHIGSNPRLTELDLGGALREDVTYALVPFGCLLAQLETLTLSLHLGGLRDELPNFGELRNLRHLILGFRLEFDITLKTYTKLIAAAPVLSKLTLMFAPPYCEVRRIEQTVLVQPHGSLKEVETFGFLGVAANFEMTKYAVTNAVNLEKLVINPMHPKECIMQVRERRAEVDQDVKDLQKVLPLSAKLIVVGM